MLLYSSLSRFVRLNPEATCWTTFRLSTFFPDSTWKALRTETRPPTRSCTVSSLRILLCAGLCVTRFVHDVSHLSFTYDACTLSWLTSKGFADAMKGLVALGFIDPDEHAALHQQAADITWVSGSQSYIKFQLKATVINTKKCLLIFIERFPVYAAEPIARLLRRQRA